MRRRGFTLLEIMVVLMLLGVLVFISLGFLTAWRETVAVEAGARLLQGDLEFAAQQARAFSLQPQGVSSGPLPPPQPDIVLYARVVRKEAGQPLVTIKQHPIGKGFRYLVQGDMVQIDVSNPNFQGVAFQIAPEFIFSAASVVFTTNGQPVTLAGVPTIALNSPTIIFGTLRRAVEIKMSATGAVQSQTLTANPF